MDLDLSADQDLFLATTHKFLEANWSISSLRSLLDDTLGVDRTLLARGADLGWTSMLVPDELGGGTISGAGVRDLAIVAEELGRALVPGPVLPTNVVASALARVRTAGTVATHLAQMAAGKETATWAVAEEGDSWAAETGAVEAVRGNGGFRLNGIKSPVQDARVVDQVFIVTRSVSGITQFLVPSDAPGLKVEPLAGLDLTRRFDRVHLDGVEVPETAVVGEPDQDPLELDHQLGLTLALQCAETVGATARVFDFTLDYVRHRKAFGRPIGSYQALKHRLADMLLWLESAHAATGAAVEAVQGGGARALEAARVAKAYVADRCPVIVRECLQFHGGIGYTWEHDLHLYLRRVETNAAIYGGPDYHRDRLAPTVGF